MLAGLGEPHRPVDPAYEVKCQAESLLERRLGVHQRLLLGPDGFALGQRPGKLLLDPAALVAVDSVPQLGAQFLNVLIDRHLRLLDVGERRHRRSWWAGGVKERGTRPAEPASGGAEMRQHFGGTTTSLGPSERHGILGRSEQTSPNPDGSKKPEAGSMPGSGFTVT